MNVTVLLTPYLIRSGVKYNRAVVGQDGRLYGLNPSNLKLLIWKVQSVPALQWAANKSAAYAILRRATKESLRGAAKSPIPALAGFYVDDTHTLQARSEALVEALQNIKDWAAENASSLELIYTPLALELDFEQMRTKARESGVSVDSNAAAEVARAAAAILDVPLHDLRPALARIRGQGRSLSVPGDHHYNAETSRACAEYLWAGALFENRRARMGDT